MQNDPKIELANLSKISLDRYSWNIEFGDSVASKAAKSIILEDDTGNQIVCYINDDENAESVIKKYKDDYNVQGSFILHNIDKKALKSKSIIYSAICEGDLDKNCLYLVKQQEGGESFGIEDINLDLNIKQSDEVIVVNVIVVEQQDVVKIQIQRFRTVEYLKELIEGQTKYRTFNQILKFGKTLLNDHSTLKNQNINDNDEIYLSLKENIGCFVGETLIATSVILDNHNSAKFGYTMIKEMKDKDAVVAFDEKSASYVMDTVTSVVKERCSHIAVITLETGEVIGATPNHTFLTSEGWKRCISLDKDDLVGILTLNDYILRGNNTRCRILSINFETHVNQIDVYHLGVCNNHTFLPYGFVAHNMEIVVRKIKRNVRIRLSVQPSTKIKQLKQMIESQWQIPLSHQKLRFASIQLLDQKSLSDYNIKKQTEISLIEVNIQGFSAKSEIIAQGQVGMLISAVQQETNLMTHCFNENSKKIMTVFKNEKFSRNRFVRIVTENNLVLQCSQDFYFFTDQNKWKCSQSQDIDGLVKGDAIMTYKGSFQKITIIQKIFNRRPIDFYHLETIERANFFVSNVLVEPAVKITIIMSNENSQKQLKNCLNLMINKRSTIYQLKQKILHTKKIQKSVEQIKKLKIFQEDNLLQDNMTIEKITASENCIFTLLENKDQILKRVIKSKIITLQNENNKIHIGYNQVKDLKVKNIINQHVENSRPEYCFIYNNRILMPYEKIDSIELNEHFIEENITLIVFKCSEKFIVSKFFEEKVEYDYDEAQFTDNVKEKLLKLRSIPAPNSLNPSQKRALQHYICEVFKTETDQFLATMHSFEPAEIVSKREYKYVNNLFRTLQTLKNYYGECYRVLPNFKLSTYNKVGDVFTWRSFVSTSTSLQQTMKKMDQINNKGTLFHILSTNGKDLDLLNDKKESEIVFEPYSYFTVEKIVVRENFEEVWLIEMASPIYFKKNLILWVDDNPENNIIELEIIDKPELEVLQLRSTAALMQWMKQFGWLMTWKGINMRIISDMVRREGNVDNYYAGIDLLEKAFNQTGLTTPIIIFCGQPGRARKNVNERGIRKDRVYRVTSDPIEIYSYAQFKELA